MKVLPDEEENYLLDVELGPYDLPPPAGKLPNPFGDTEIPLFKLDADRAAAHTGPDPFEPVNIKLQLPMFESLHSYNTTSLNLKIRMILRAA